MPRFTVTRRLTASPEAVWAVLADFGNVGWIPGPGDVRVEGEGAGMRRFIAASSEKPVIETLIWIDPDRRALSYEIANNPMPVSRFVVVNTVHDTESDEESSVDWDIDYSPIGNDAAAREAIEGVYGLMAGWVQDFANARGRH
ncbi:SRPBCC family protein [Mycobacterium sp. 94-17]|uniref:SRPBCC family protein n=1 Tax=Mycobacterium sp. 94-17 TaxID=2986147 RepID=UPI002D1EE945|nr:SRPBCC family protein [Mycobacterium sp. 94-17]MEB4212134.1 SRPBCC family protein [Mycobacterium sp. 94-17]